MQGIKINIKSNTTNNLTTKASKEKNENIIINAIGFNSGEDIIIDKT